MAKLLISLDQTLTADDSIYGVRVVAEDSPDGRWDTRLEFESGSGIRLSAVAQDCASSEDLREWTSSLDERALREALARASVGRIERREDP